MLGYNELVLNDTPERDSHRIDLEEIDKAGRRAADLTRQLLALGRKQNLDRRVTDLNTLIQDFSKIVSRVIGENIRIEFDFAPALNRAMTDHSQITQILLNLAVNARDAMPRGGKLLFSTRNRTLTDADLAARPDIRAGQFVSISITDTGTGIAPEVMEKIFEPFFTTKEPGRGTGLGLATSYGIARQHGGWIDVESRVGVGSTFRLFLPAIDAPDAPPPYGSTETREPPPRGRGERILFAEDDDAVRDLVRRQLDRAGYVVVAACNAAAARSAIDAAGGAFDLVMTDVVLPDFSGIELLQELTARKPDLRVLVSSGYTDNEKRWPVILERKWPFIAKPYAMAGLLVALRKLLPAR